MHLIEQCPRLEAPRLAANLVMLDKCAEGKVPTCALVLRDSKSGMSQFGLSPPLRRWSFHVPSTSALIIIAYKE